ncbi:putative nuclease HARBI1 isoform X2 [Tanacetum coccineum]
MEFAACDLEWSKIKGFCDNLDRLALIPYPRVDDFVRGESNNKDCPTNFQKASCRTSKAKKAKVDGTFGSVLIQESSRKDIERAFGVLQGRWGIIRQPARAFEINALKMIMYCCVMLHNMILEDEDFVVNLRDVFVDPTPDIPQEWTERCDLHVRKRKELRDSKVHNDLRDDLVEHVWN